MSYLFKISGVALAVGMSVTACSGAGGRGVLGPSEPIVAPLARLPVELKPGAAERGYHGRSWMNPKAKAGALLYLSDLGTNDVYVYSWPQLDLVGMLTGLYGPAGECADRNGNVWIVNLFASDVVEYAHGGTTPIATLADPGQYPIACAVSKGGELAVANSQSASGGAGSVTIYPGEAGSGMNYPDSNTYVDFVGYDGARLFVDGSVFSSGVVSLQVLKNGAYEPFAVRGASLGYTGDVMGRGNVLVVGDQTGPSGYPLLRRINKKGLVIGGTVLLSGSCEQFTISGKMLICPDSSNANVSIYDYPAGGAATQAIVGSFSSPFGSAISQ